MGAGKEMIISNKPENELLIVKTVRIVSNYFDSRIVNQILLSKHRSSF